MSTIGRRCWRTRWRRENGFIQAPEEPGFGMKIKPEAWNHAAAVRQVSGR